MLSGSRPRGSSSTPFSGKIGSVSGSSSKGKSKALPVISSREEDRGEAAPPRDGERVGRAHRFEELHQLLAPSLLVPGAVAPHQLEQLVDRRLALAGGEQRRRQIEPRLVVLRIGGEALPQ